MHQFVDASIALYNPDEPGRAVNSPRAVYQIAPESLSLLQLYGSPGWAEALTSWLARQGSLAERYANAREQKRVPVQLPSGTELSFSAGEHSTLIAAVVTDFASHFAPGSSLLYAGDTENKWAHFDQAGLAALGVTVDAHGKMPDVILHFTKKDWLSLVECVTSHGPVNAKRHAELAKLFAGSTAGLVYVTAFPNRSLAARHLTEIAWETEIWLADAPTHLIHLNGERFLGPYKT